MATNQLELFSIPNPCIGVCESNAKGYCKGCLRSRQERFNWHQKTEQEQRHIITLITQRKRRIKYQIHQQKNNTDENSQPDLQQQDSLFNKS